MEGYEFFGGALVAAILGSAICGVVLRVVGAIIRRRNVGNRWELSSAIGLQGVAALYFSITTFHDLVDLMAEIDHPVLFLVLLPVFPIVFGLYVLTYVGSLFMLILCYRAGEIVYDKLFPALVAKRETKSWQRTEALMNERIKSESVRLRK